MNKVELLFNVKAKEKHQKQDCVGSRPQTDKAQIYNYFHFLMRRTPLQRYAATFELVT